jgi:2-amino-4-hydroxy-6-hydroxymethyldihydropteridine diphosphokinase
VTKPTWNARQADFCNQVVVFPTKQPAARMLKFFKNLERAAGRRPGTGRRWGPRPLDIDIIDHRGLVTRWPSSISATCPGRIPTCLILPHPQAHLRAFVLVPLLEVLPHWWHPALRRTGRQLLARLDRRTVKSMLDQKSRPCE